MEQETARILVVDDDSELRLLIKEYLEKNGFTVDTVESEKPWMVILVTRKLI